MYLLSIEECQEYHNDYNNLLFLHNRDVRKFTARHRIDGRLGTVSLCGQLFGMFRTRSPSIAETARRRLSSVGNSAGRSADEGIPVFASLGHSGSDLESRPGGVRPLGKGRQFRTLRRKIYERDHEGKHLRREFAEGLQRTDLFRQLGRFRDHRQ